VEKAPEAFRTISEVADELDIPKHVLRFWEGRFPQLKPMKRGGGRRYYRPEDVDLVRGIRRLLYDEGYTIRGVQRILKEQGARSLMQPRDAGLGPDARRSLDIPDVAAEAAANARGEANGHAPSEIADLEEGGMLGYIVDEIERCRKILEQARS
jgi:DNA-binding transcriptional MerR regulator